MQSLDGLRFFAFFAVFVCHALQNNDNALVRTVVHYGALGVQVFFVLSGFLIGRILLEAKQQSWVSIGSRLRTFYARRALRIFPLYYLILLVLFVLPLLGFPAVGIGADWWWHATYLTNMHWYFVGGLSGGIAHLWSLAVEEHFYMLAPVVVLYGSIRGLSRAFVVVWILCALARLWFGLRHDEDARVLSPMQFDCMTIGMAAAMLQTSGRFLSFDLPRALRLSAMCAVVSPVLLLLRQAPEPFKLVGLVLEQWVLSVAVAGLVLLLWNGKSPILTRLLTTPPLTYLGKISYGLYMFHLPCLIWAYAWLGPYMRGTAVPALAMNIGLAMLSWHLFESPINGLKRYFPYAAK